MLDATTAVGAVVGAGALILNAYLIGVRPARQELRARGDGIEKEHKAACQSLEKGAGLAFATRLSRSAALTGLLSLQPEGTSASRASPQTAATELETMIDDYRMASNVHDQMYEVKRAYGRVAEALHTSWVFALLGTFLAVICAVLYFGGRAESVPAGLASTYLYILAMPYSIRWWRENVKLQTSQEEFEKNLREHAYFPTSEGTTDLSSPPRAP